jgi:hypothetical protein
MSNRHNRLTLRSLAYWFAFHLVRSVAIPPIGPRHARSSPSQM